MPAGAVRKDSVIDNPKILYISENLFHLLKKKIIKNVLDTLCSFPDLVYKLKFCFFIKVNFYLVYLSPMELPFKSII